MADEAVKLGVDNVKPMLGLVIELGNVTDKMGRTQGMERYGQLMLLIDELAALGAVKIDQVIPELSDLDDVERASLMAYAKEKFDIADDKLEMVIEEGLAILVDAYSIVQRSIKLVKAAGAPAA